MCDTKLTEVLIPTFVCLLYTLVVEYDTYMGISGKIDQAVRVNTTYKSACSFWESRIQCLDR